MTDRPSVRFSRRTCDTLKKPSQQTSFGAGYLYKYMSVLYPLANNDVSKILFWSLGNPWFFHALLILIAMINPRMKNLLTRKRLLGVERSSHTEGKRRDKAMRAIGFIYFRGAGVPTTCCYQYIGLDLLNDDLE